MFKKKPSLTPLGPNEEEKVAPKRGGKKILKSNAVNLTDDQIFDIYNTNLPPILSQELTYKPSFQADGHKNITAQAK